MFPKKVDYCVFFPFLEIGSRVPWASLELGLLAVQPRPALHSLSSRVSRPHSEIVGVHRHAWPVLPFLPCPLFSDRV